MLNSLRNSSGDECKGCNDDGKEDEEEEEEFHGNNHFRKKIPKNSEGSTVLLGGIPNLQVRLNYYSDIYLILDENEPNIFSTPSPSSCAWTRRVRWGT